MKLKTIRHYIFAGILGTAFTTATAANWAAHMDSLGQKICNAFAGTYKLGEHNYDLADPTHTIELNAIMSCTVEKSLLPLTTDSKTKFKKECVRILKKAEYSTHEGLNSGSSSLPNSLRCKGKKYITANSGSARATVDTEFRMDFIKPSN